MQSNIQIIQQHIENEDYPAANNCIDQLPSAEDQEYWRIILCSVEHNHEQALAQCLSVLPKWKKSSLMWSAYAWLQHELGNLEAAYGGYEKALALEKTPKNSLNFAMLLCEMGEYTQAQEWLHTISIREYPQLEQGLLLTLANVHRHLGNLQEGLHIVQCMVPSVESCLLMGHLYRDQSLFTESLVSYQQGLDIEAEHPVLLQCIASVAQLIPQLPPGLKDYVQTEHAQERQQVALRRYLEKTYADLLQMSETDPCNIHLKNAIHGKNPEQPPEGYVQALFDDYASRFESHLLEKLSYQVPNLIASVVRKRFTQDKPAKSVLDLGVGTGLVGALISDVTEQMVGVDISENMLALAKEKNIYTELIASDITAYLHKTTAQFPVVIIADTLVYFGSLDAVFAGLAKVLEKGGCCVCTVEKGDMDSYEQSDFQLQHTGRYAHSIGYIHRLAHTHGLVVAKFGEVDLRQGSGLWVKGWLVLVEKPKRKRKA